MNNFFTLLKVDLINGFSLNKNFSKNKKNRKAQKSTTLGLTILIFVLLAISSFSYAFMVATLASSAGRLEILLAYGVSIGALVTLMLTFANAYGTLFKSRDYELLASLPIKTKTIVASKLASLTIVDYAYFSIAFIPSLIIYIIKGGASFSLVAGAIIVFLFGPLLVASVCSIIAYIVGSIVSHFKNKNTISTILYVTFTIALVVGIYVINFTMPDESDSLDVKIAYAEKMYKLFTTIYPVTIIAVKGMMGQWLYLLIYIAIMVVPYVLFAFIIANKYIAINLHARESYKSANYDITKEKKAKAKGLTKTLLLKEVKTLVSTPVYLANVVIGPIMSAIVIVFAAYMVIYKVGTNAEGVVDIPYAIGPNVVCAVSMFLTGIAPASGCSISMEGKKFWIIKSLPIDARKYLRSKIIFSYLLLGPIAAIACVVANIIIGANVLDFICIILVSQVAAILYSLVGLLLNLKFYNLDWDNPNQAVKQGANIYLAMIIDFAIFGHLAVVLFIGLSFMVSLTWVMLILISIVCLIFGLILKKHGVKMYNKISA